MRSGFTGETCSGERKRSDDPREDAGPQPQRAGVPPGRWATEAELAKAFEDSRKATMTYLQTTNDDLRDQFFDHPAFGPLDGHQWLVLISGHSARHTARSEK
jgi:hypothetical protein